MAITPRPLRVCTHWNGNDILTKFSSLAAPEVVEMTTSGASDENFVKMIIFSAQIQKNIFHSLISQSITCVPSESARCLWVRMRVHTGPRWPHTHAGLDDLVLIQLKSQSLETDTRQRNKHFWSVIFYQLYVMDIKGKVAVVTGAARGLGKAYGEELLRRGAKVRPRENYYGKFDIVVYFSCTV